MLDETHGAPLFQEALHLGASCPHIRLSPILSHDPTIALQTTHLSSFFKDVCLISNKWQASIPITPRYIKD